MIRERLDPPRIVRLPELPDLTGGLHDEHDDGSAPMSGSRSPAAFRRAFERRRWESDAIMTIYGFENGLDHPRLGISVSRKKVKTAAARNRLKRLIREAFRLSKAELPAGLDLIVVPRHPAPAVRRGPAIAARSWPAPSNAG